MNNEEAQRVIQALTFTVVRKERIPKDKINMVLKALNIGMDALEKQVAKNWIAEYIGDGDFIWKCPSCNEKFVLLDGTPQDNRYNHCPNCGQALAERRSDEE